MSANTTSRAVNEKMTISPLAAARQWDDAALVTRALDGDPFAKNAIYRQHAPYLLDLATRLTRRRSDGDDILQETFLVAFRKLAHLENPRALRPWLTRIMICQVRKMFRIKRFRAFFGLRTGDEDATLSLLAVHDARPDLRVTLKEIDAVLQQTPTEWRTAWMLHRVEGMSIKETSRAVNRSTATVKRYVGAVDAAVQFSRGDDR